jgi:hypothetical protein
MLGAYFYAKWIENLTNRLSTKYSEEGENIQDNERQQLI